eukprot:470157-Pyramimonas_sp.AAC.1
MIGPFVFRSDGLGKANPGMSVGGVADAKSNTHAGESSHMAAMPAAPFPFPFWPFPPPEPPL